jgi:excisionase family DNA binding protein
MKLLSVKEVARRLDISESLVRRYCREGRIEAQKIGGWAITEAALKELETQPRRVGRPPKRHD